MKVTPKSWLYIGVGILCLILFAALLKTALKRTSFMDAYHKGYNAFLLGAYTEAKDAFETCARIYPEFHGIDPLLAAAYFYEGDYTNARRVFEKINTPSGRAGLILTGFQEAAGQNKVTQAFIDKIISELKAVEKENPNILANTATLALQGDLSEDQLQTYTNIIKTYVLGNGTVYPVPLAAAYNSLGCLLMRAREYGKAAEAFDLAGKFVSLPSLAATIRGNRVAAGVSHLSKERDFANRQNIEDVRQQIRSLTPANRVNAQINIANAFLDIGQISLAGDIVRGLEESNPERSSEINNLKMAIMRKKALQPNADPAAAFAQMSLYVESILGKLEADPEAIKAMYDIQSLFYFITGFYHANQQTANLAATLGQAVKMYPDDFSFQRNLGIILLQQDKVSEGYEYLQRSLKLKPDQPDLERFFQHLFAPITVRDMTLATNAPFSPEQPLIKVRFSKNEYQNNPRVLDMTLGDEPLKFITQGAFFMATPFKPLPSGFRDYTVNITTENAISGKRSTHTVRSEQDLNPPDVTVHFPARDSKVRLTDFYVDLEMKDDRSGIDFSSLQVIVFSTGSSERQAFRLYAVKSGIFQQVRLQRGKEVATERIKFTPTIPITGGYALSIIVFDKMKNKRFISDWNFTVEP